ncbi:MAG: hypothetical protein KAS94_03445 [Desulfobulbaceae bacterium]|nr:hypothetical protein [Desulfobulbaceae bacterium]
MNKTVFSILLATFLVGATTIFCFADDGWQANILISSGDASSKLTFGQNQAATDLNDGFYDVPALFSGQLQAAFTDGEGMLWRDIRDAGSEAVKEWRINITSASGETITVSWDQERLPKNAKVALIDVDTGKAIDMQVLSSYAMENRNGGELLIQVSNIHRDAKTAPLLRDMIGGDLGRAEMAGDHLSTKANLLSESFLAATTMRC